MRPRLISARPAGLVLAIVGLVVIALLVLRAARSAVYAQANVPAVATPPPTPAAFPPPHLVPVTGIPAIQTGPITQDVVTSFVTAHPVPPRFKAVGTPTVARVTLMTSKDVSALLHGERTGLSDASMVYFVEMHGTFTFMSPLGRAFSYPVAYEVFDATTGNLVLEGALALSPSK